VNFDEWWRLANETAPIAAGDVEPRQLAKYAWFASRKYRTSKDAIDEFVDAWRDLGNAIYEALGLNRLLDWLAGGIGALSQFLSR